jgi:hypothetical protein
VIYSINKIQSLLNTFERVYILGKGPSLNKKSYNNINKQNSCIISINQVVAVFKVDFAFFIDIEPLYDVIDVLIKYKVDVIIPYHPNIRTTENFSQPSSLSIYDLSKGNSKLCQLLESNNVYCFDTGLQKNKISNFIFKPNLVSVTSLIQIIFKFFNGDKTYGIGFDGGSGKSKHIENKHDYSQLKSYSKQFDIIKKIEVNNKKKFINLSMKTINIYVGASEDQYIPTKVLEFSIKKYSSINVNVIPLYKALSEKNIQIPLSTPTPFSLQRLYIPLLNNYEGIAVYLDSDMLVFNDIKNLIDSHDHKFNLCSAPAPPKSGRRDQFSVFTVDCSKAKWDPEKLVEEAAHNYKKILFQFEFEQSKLKCLPWQWNSLEYFDSNTNLIHFTDMDKQPWISTENSNKDLWVKYLKETINSEFIEYEDVYNSVKRNECRPGILDQIRIKDYNYKSISVFSKIKDFFYSPIHTVNRFSSRNNFLVRASISVLKKVKNLFINEYDK